MVRLNEYRVGRNKTYSKRKMRAILGILTETHLLAKDSSGGKRSAKI